MEHWGAPFSRFADGTIAQRPFGGAGFPRTCYAADRTGHVLLHTLYEQAVRRGITVYDERAVTRLVVDDGRCHGRDRLRPQPRPVGKLRRARIASSPPAATAGSTAKSTNALINTGGGIGMALAAGIPVKDMEFVQFHPTTLYGTNILMTEGARGEGGYLVNRQGRAVHGPLRAQGDGAGPARHRRPLHADRNQ